MRVQPKQSGWNLGGGQALVPLAFVVVLALLVGLARGIALAIAFMFLCVVVLFVGASAWFMTWQRRVEAGSDGDRLFVASYFGERRPIGERDAGSVAMVDIVEPKFRDTWMVWLDGTGVPTWAALGRNWPLDDLERMALLFGIDRVEAERPMTRKEFTTAYPRTVTWFQLHSASLFMYSLYAVVVVASSIGLAWFRS